MATTQQRPDASRTKSPAGPETIPPLRGAWWKWATGLLMAYVCYGAFFVAHGDVTFGASGNSARIVFFHVPSAILAYVAYAVGFVYALLYLIRRGRQRPDLETDAKSAAAMELGFLFCILATITGSIFAGMVWNSYWNWDPRETSIVIMLLLYAAYLVLRGAIEQPERRARLSAVYAVVALIPATYLIWVVPRIMATNHPTTTLQDPANTSLAYKAVLYPSFLAFTWLFVWLFQLRFRLYEVMARQQRGA
jgi:heme exporter protein C